MAASRGNQNTMRGSISKKGPLRFYNNSLHGEVPDTIGLSQSWLKGLYLEHNSLRGTLPDVIGSLQALWYLVVKENDLSGALPASVGCLTMIASLFVSENLSASKSCELCDCNSELQPQARNPCDFRRTLKRMSNSKV